MFLKRIELSGFKSFADRTNLEFGSGITAIVGPNGSGKSNVSDAIRWVLGEQSARSLRGGTMQDIIFSGSDSRRAVNIGEVTLILDNSSGRLPLDYQEISVTRRIHRSGESEYLINKQPCRLRDVAELFMDTGLGREAYSIIGQGRIDEILSTRPEDRRGIFEEASGIVKYRYRKKEAQKKLADTDQNLLRIHDLLSELSDQLEPLQHQAQKAIRYRELKEELRKNEVSLFVHQIDRLHEQWTSSNQELDLLNENRVQVTTELNVFNARFEEERMEVRRLEEQLETLQRDLLMWSEGVEKTDGQLGILRERRNHLQLQKQAKKDQIHSFHQQSEQYNEKVEAIRERIASLQNERSVVQEKLQQAEAELKYTLENVPDEEQLKSDLLELLNRLAQKRNERQFITQQQGSLNHRTEQVKNENQERQSKIERLNEDCQTMQEKLRNTDEQLAEIKSEVEMLHDSMVRTRRLLDEAIVTIRKWEQRYDGLKSRRDTLQELQNDYDGFFYGVRQVLKHAGRPGGIRGVHGAIANLIHVDEAYETAIETALGNALQHIVMDDEATSRQAIAWLKQKKMGRATFYPLTVIRGRTIAHDDLERIKNQEGFVGMAIDLISFDPKYREVLSSLLGQVIISDQLEQANRIAAACHYKYRVVTLDGDVVHTGGSMTGGSQNKRTTHLLSRQREIDTLTKQMSECEANVNRLTKESSALEQKLRQIDDRLSRLQQTSETKRLEKEQLNVRYEQLVQEVDHLRLQMEVDDQQFAEFQAEMQELETAKRQIEQEIAALEEQEQTIRAQIDLAETERKVRQEKIEQAQGNITSMKVQLAALHEQCLSAENEFSRLQEEWNSIRMELQKAQDEIVELERMLSENEEESVALQKSLNEAVIKREQIGKQIEQTKMDRAEKYRGLEEEERKIESLREQLKTIEQQFHQCEVRTNRLDVELDNVLNKLAEDYGLSYELAKERFPAPENVSQTENTVRDLKRQISILGDVNIGAIEEYDRVSERHRFLEEQRNDLVEAKETLLKVIDEMEKEMSQRFLATFEQIRERFQTVFSNLFGGGRADLVLTEPEDLLSTGVEIVAQPPGKKLQNLQLLSGGERAMTAIALLFAILHVKPVPFCVLDEVEAALDDANVVRFAQYLKTFSDETQFIVVTHRKGTMEVADVLYGVAMEDDGVSKLVSVRLEEIDTVSA